MCICQLLIQNDVEVILREACYVSALQEVLYKVLVLGRSLASQGHYKVIEKMTSLVTSNRASFL